MAASTKFFVHVSTLIAQARLKCGFATLKELYRIKEPQIEYQTWLHAEAGRRIPSPSTLVIMSEILEIDRETMIIAYCKDKFPDEKSHHVIESFECKKYLNIDTMLQAKEHERTQDYVFNTEQLAAIQSDIRLRLYLNYTYDNDLKTTVSQLANYFGVEKLEAKGVINHLKDLGLVDVIDEDVKKIHRHTTLPMSVELFPTRRESLLKTLQLNIKPSSYVANYHVNINENSNKRLLRIFDLLEATLIKMDKEDSDHPDSFRCQIAIALNNLKEGNQNDRG